MSSGRLPSAAKLYGAITNLLAVLFLSEGRGKENFIHFDVGEFGKKSEPVADLNWAEIKSPDDVKFKEWRGAKFREFVTSYGSKQEDFKTLSVENINAYRFLMGLLKHVEKSRADWSVISSTIEKLAAAKRAIIDQAGARLDGNDLKAVEQVMGKTINDTLKNGEIDWKLAGRFDAHGIGKGKELASLQNFLDNGVDKDRNLYTSNFFEAGQGAYMGGGINGPYSEGGFIVVSGPDKSLKQDGVAMVIVNWQYREAAAVLARKYPHITFATPEGMKAAFEHVAK